MKKKPHQTQGASFIRALAHLLAPSMPILVCKTCVMDGDVVIDESGDYAICDRCGESITSKTGVGVRRCEGS